jgi:hypothetical protein
MSIPFVYRNSPLNLPDLPAGGSWKSAPLLGSKLPDQTLEIWQDARRTEIRLRKLTGTGFLVLYAARDESDADKFISQAILPPSGLPGRVVPVLSGLPFLKPGDILMLRPDGHLAARRRSFPPAELGQLITRLCHP